MAQYSYAAAKEVKEMEAISLQLVSTLPNAPPGHTIMHQVGMAHGRAISFQRIRRQEDYEPGRVLRMVCEDAHTAAYNEMVVEAAKMGANAVLGVRYEFHNLMQPSLGSTEVLCYGTGVVLAQGGSQWRAVEQETLQVPNRMPSQT